MNNPLLLALIGILVFTSCRSSRDIPQSFSLEEAYWYNWVGGQPGIGGTAYELRITGIADEEISFKNLILDDQVIPISKTEVKGGTYILYASENKSKRNKTMIGSDRTARPDFRTANPQAATLTGILDGKPFELEIKNFEKQPNKNMQ